MPSDNPVARRNALVIPGGLVLSYCVIAILYAELVRSDDTLCHDGGLILIRNACYNVWKLMLPLVLIASGVLLGGALGFRTRRTGPTAGLYHGSGSHFTLALLASFVVVPFVGLLAQFIRERSLGTVFVIHAYGIAFQHTFLLAVATLIGAMAFFPYLALYLHQDKRRRSFLDAAELPRAEPVLRVPEPPADEGDGMWAPLEEEWDGEEPWDSERGPGATDDLGAAAEVTEIIPEEPPAEALAEIPAEPQPAPVLDPGSFLAAVQAREEAARARAEAEAEARAAEAEALAAAEAEAAATGPGSSPASVRARTLFDVDAEVDRLQEHDEPVRSEVYHDYPGIMRPVGEVPGINRAMVTLLAQAGVRTTAALRHHTDAELAHAASVPERRVQQWKVLAELLCVPGIGPSYAQALVAAGIDGVDGLKRLSTETILKRLGPERAASITPKRVQAWQEAAKGMRRVRQPIPGE